MKTLRIFISSPGDVEEERDRARRVIEGLRRRYAAQFDLKPLLWEDLPLQADMPFQKGIDIVLSTDNGVDIAIFILWARMGSPLGEVIRKPDGSEYRSGTEREFDLMMRARVQSGGKRPHILFYNRLDDSSFDERLRQKPAREIVNLGHQKELVETFISEQFRDAETGVNVGAYHSFDRPVTFMQRLRTHLQELLDHMADVSALESIWDIEKKGPPFMGLEAFQPRHADVFFGREEEILEARCVLRKQAQNGCAFLLLSGASGSGKSSLARAGILPAIVDLELDEMIAGWRTLIITPAELAPDPIQALVSRLTADDVLPEARNNNLSPDDLVQGLKKDPALTYQLRLKPAFSQAAQQKGAVRLLLLLDQLEELFGATSISATDRAAFLAVLEILAKSGNVWVLATVRADFYPQVQNEPVLVRMKSGGGQFDVLPPGVDALRCLVEEPAHLAGLRFEKRNDQSLSGKILNDATAHAELLPLLEFVLRELYEKRTNGTLTFEAYEELGGVEGALATRAEQVFSGLPADAQAALPLVLQALITLGRQGGGNVNPGEEQRLVRQRASLSVFDGNPAAMKLVNGFVAARLFTADSNPKSGEASVTVAHESLIRVWQRAATWAKHNQDQLLTRARIAARLQEGSPLLKGDPLLEAAKAVLEMGFLSKEEADFVRTSLRNVAKEQFQISLRNGEKMLELSNELRVSYPDLRQEILRAVLRSGNGEEEVKTRTNAAILLGMGPVEELTRELARLVLEDPNGAVCRAAAASLIQLNQPEYFDELAKKLGDGTKSEAIRALAYVRAAADAIEKPTSFEALFGKLKSRERSRIISHARFLRLKRGWPTLFLVLIPAIVLSSIFASLFKIFPGAVNYAICQASASAPTGFFDAIVACFFWGGIITFCVTFHRVVYRSELGKKSALQPWTALVAGAIGGIISSALLLLVMTLVCDVHGTQDMGWTTKDWHSNWRGFWDEVLWKTRSFWPYMFMGTGLGIGMAATANGLWASNAWRSFIGSGKQSLLTGKDSLALVKPLSKLILPFMWPIPVCMLLADLISFYVVRTAPFVADPRVIPNLPPPLAITSWSQALWGGMSHDAASLTAWKLSAWGQGLGIFFDSATQSLGGFFCIVGISLGLIAIRYGIKVEARKN